MISPIKALKEQLKVHTTEADKLYRLEVEGPDISLLSTLKNQDQYPKIYWKDRNTNEEVAGLGIAQKTDQFPPNTPLPENTRYYGGIAFNKEITTTWKGFTAQSWHIPQIEFIKTQTQTKLACNFKKEDKAHLLHALDLLNLEPDSGPIPRPTIQKTTHFPQKKDWVKTINQALESINTQVLTKVVLARQTIFKFKAKVSPYDIIATIREKEAEAFHFIFEYKEGTAFIGGTPERLFKRIGTELKTEAIAATKPRGNTAQEEAEFEQDLMGADKNRREHNIVVADIKEKCLKISEKFQEAVPKILKLAKLQHRITKFEAKLQPGITDKDILTLHPTPAVAGTPTQAALSFISAHEPFSRGWFAGPIGSISPEKSECVVAIRSGIVENNTVTLFAGAGIVSGSDPEKEWQELNDKISLFSSLYSNEYSKV